MKDKKKISSKAVLLICLAAVALTAAVCGFAIWKTWKDTKTQTKDSVPSTKMDQNDEESSNQEMTGEALMDVTAFPTLEVTPEVIPDVTVQETTEVISEEAPESPNPPETEQVTEDMLVILRDPEVYTYENMKQDLEILPKMYERWVSVDSLGQTLDGREIYHLVIGKKDAVTRIFVNGGIHGREYMTSQLVMKQAVSFLKHLTAGDMYAGQTYEQLFSDTVIHVVPMINPDGISISQLGLDGLIYEETKERVKEISALDGEVPEGYYLKRWKANANGVDINRNFDALWESYAGSSHPSSDHYKGESIGCEPESTALIQLTKQELFDRTISYHTQGGVIYWYFGQDGSLYDETLDFANAISKLTGYPTDANYEYLDPAGYKDWGISKLGIAGLTIEIGKETSPVPASQFPGIWNRNQYVWEEAILNAKKYGL